MQLQGLEIIGGQYSVHPGDLERLLFPDALDAGVGDGRSNDIHVQHPRQLDVVDVDALSLDEASVFFA